MASKVYSMTPKEIVAELDKYIIGPPQDLLEFGIYDVV